LAGFVKKQITEMKPGDKIDSIFSVHYKKSISEYKYGSMFEFRAADRSGQINVKFWGGEDPAEVLKIFETVGRDVIVQVRGTVGEYKGSMELAVNPSEGGMVKALGEGEYDIRELIATIDNIPELMDRLMKAVYSVKDPHYSNLLGKLFEDRKFSDDFSKCPASIMLHSAQIGGLVYHTLNVLDHCLVAWEHYREMDRDLLTAGAILHDIGKVRSFRVTTNINQTEEGILLGHLVIGMEMVRSKISEIPDFPADKQNKLLHIILSHHGRKEWGSPVEPATPEAQTVHLADDFDAKLSYITMRREEATTDDNFIWDQRFKRHIYLG